MSELKFRLIIILIKALKYRLHNKWQKMCVELHILCTVILFLWLLVVIKTLFCFLINYNWEGNLKPIWWVHIGCINFTRSKIILIKRFFSTNQVKCLTRPINSYQYHYSTKKRLWLIRRSPFKDNWYSVHSFRKELTCSVSFYSHHLC